jgi:hypothetical protein
VFSKKDKKPGSINLAKRMQKGLGDRFLTWAFTVGRAILMIVYAIALGAFAYRFVLDREVIDLGDKIKQEQTIVSLSEESEKEFRSLQDKLAFIKETNEVATNEVALMDSLIRLATGRILFTSLSITPLGIQMEGSARSIGSLNTFVEDLRKEPQIGSVSLGTIESRVDQGLIIFDLTATQNL